MSLGRPDVSLIIPNFKDWRLGQQTPHYIKILLWFLDSNTAPYSIHRIALLGKQYDKEIGEWFGPSTISQVLR